MQDFTILKPALDEVHWIKSNNTIPEWTKRGIAHGFEGKHRGSPDNLYFPYQVHGVACHEVQASFQHASASRPAGDGIYSLSGDCAIAVQTADCLPVLFYHPRLVMAIHAGWRGLAKGILFEALRVYELNAIPFHEVWIGTGPAISTTAFEVGPEVVTAFQEMFEHFHLNGFQLILAKGVHDRWHLDLGLAAVLSLIQRSILPQNIWCLRNCTVQESEDWHSYRRSGKSAGRNWSWIRL